MFVIQHLNAVLNPAQTRIDRTQIISRFLIGMASLGELLQHIDRTLAAQFRCPSAMDQLLRLSKKLDFPYAAAAELYIKCRIIEPLMAAMRVDLLLDRPNVFNRPEIEMAAPDERLQRIEKGIGRIRIARTGTRLDIGHPLPVLTGIFVIEFSRARRNRNRRRSWIRSQTQIHPQHIAMLGLLLEQLRHVLNDPARCIARRSGGRREQVRVKHRHQVDVA